jgi:intracellular septation protein
MFFSHIFSLPDRIWTQFAIRWVLWFQFLAFLNELMWRHITDSNVAETARWFEGLALTEAFWANAKLGVMALSIAFMASQLPTLLKYQKNDEEIPDPADT